MISAEREREQWFVCQEIFWSRRRQEVTSILKRRERVPPSDCVVLLVDFFVHFHQERKKIELINKSEKRLNVEHSKIKTKRVQKPIAKSRRHICCDWTKLEFFEIISLLCCRCQIIKKCLSKLKCTIKRISLEPLELNVVRPLSSLPISSSSSFT